MCAFFFDVCVWFTMGFGYSMRCVFLVRFFAGRKKNGCMMLIYSRLRWKLLLCSFISSYNEKKKYENYCADS